MTSDGCARPGAGNAGTEDAQDVQEVAAAATDTSLPYYQSASKRKLQPRWPGLPHNYYWRPMLPRAECLGPIVMFHVDLSDSRDRLQAMRIRPNPDGGKRPWLASVNRSMEVELTERELRDVRRFAAAFHRNEWCWQIRRSDGIGSLALFHLPSQARWDKMIGAVVAKFAGGAE
jgi:hypothetical protein